MNKDQRSERPNPEDYAQALQSMDTLVDIGVHDLMTLAQRAEYFASQRVTEALNVTRIMSQPVRTVRADTPMSEAAHLMVTERISGLPVVDDLGQLIGIITEADFLRALGVPAHHPAHNLWQTLDSLFGHLAHHPAQGDPDAPVSDYMVRDVICAAPDQDLHAVIDVMKQHRVKRVLVCDAERHVLGIVTRSNLVRVFFDTYMQTDEQVPR